MKINHWFVGVVEDINDPLGQGRVRVRCFGYHNEDHTELPTEDLPWSQCVLPVTAAAAGGAGISTALQPNSWVMGFFRDEDDLQDAVVTGTFGGGGTIASIYDPASNTGFGALPINSYAAFSGTPMDTNSFNVVGGQSSSSAAFSGSLTNGGTGGAYAAPTAFEEVPPGTPPPSDAGTKFIQVALTQQGVVEVTNNQGPGIEKYWPATSYPGGYRDRQPWCAAFVSWVVKTAGVLPEADLPNTAGAFAYRAWAARKSFCQLRKAPRVVYAGDLVVFNFSHIGIAIENSTGGKVKTIEGNTNAQGSREGNGVWIKIRNLSLITDAITIGEPGSGGVIGDYTVMTPTTTPGAAAAGGAAPGSIPPAAVGSTFGTISSSGSGGGLSNLLGGGGSSTPLGSLIGGNLSSLYSSGSGSTSSSGGILSGLGGAGEMINKTFSNKTNTVSSTTVTTTTTTTTTTSSTAGGLQTQISTLTGTDSTITNGVTANSTQSNPEILAALTVSTNALKNLSS